MQILFINKNVKLGIAQSVRNRVASDLGPDALPDEFTFERLDYPPIC